MRAIRVAIAVVAIFLLGAMFAPLPAVAGSSPSESAALEMDLRVGFGGRVRAGSWAPVLIRVRTAGASLHGDLRLTSPGGARLQAAGRGLRYVYPLSLPADSEREHRAAVFVRGRTGVVRASIEVGGVVLASDEVNLARSCVDDALVVAVGGEARGAPPGLARAAAEKSLSLCEAAVSDLPDDALAYDGVRGVVLALSAAERVSDAQAAAIALWVRSGGVLVLAADTPELRALPDALQELSPVEPEPSGQAVFVTSLASLIERYGGALEPQQGVVAVAGRLRPGSIALASEGGAPILAARAAGAGSTALLAFDVSAGAFGRWGGASSLWRELLPEAGTMPAGNILDWTVAALVTAGVRYPGARPVVAFAASCVAATFAALALARRAARRTWAFFAAVCVAASVSVGLGWRSVVPLARRSSVAISSVTIVESQDRAQTARARTCAGVLPLADRVAGLAFPDRGWHMGYAALVRGPGSDGNGAERGVEVTCGRDGPALPAVRLVAREMAILAGEKVAPFALSAAVERTSDGVSLAVTNHTGMRFDDASVVSGGSAIPLGAIPDGRTTTFSVRRQEDAIGVARHDGPEDAAGSARAWTASHLALRQAILEQVVLRARLGPVLIAWAAGRDGVVSLSGVESSRADVTLVILHLQGLEPGALGEVIPG